MIKLNLNNILLETTDSIKTAYADKLNDIKKALMTKKDDEAELLGWLDWPTVNFESVELARIKNVQGEWNLLNVDAVVVIGIGGSYVGAKAGIEMCVNQFKQQPEIIFVSGLHSQYNKDLLEYLKTKNWAIIMISKSGTTFESSINFRIFREALREQYTEDHNERIIAATDKQQGVLKSCCDRHGYKTFTIPDNIGGRYSTMTPAGLLPLIIAGVDVESILNGWSAMISEFKRDDASDNSAMLYAATRHCLCTKHKKQIEIFATYENNLRTIAEHHKQIFADSEGKKLGCVLPTITNYSEDLHTIGQLYQEGINNAFETSLIIDTIEDSPRIPASSFGDDDHLNYLAGKELSMLNKQIQTAVLLAHTQKANIPNITISLEHSSCYSFGYLCAWFAIGAITAASLLGINSLVQPGVEAYKSEMEKLIK